MILDTKVFQEYANKILIATELDKSTSRLELLCENSRLELNVTNQEYSVSVSYEIKEAENFRIVVDAPLFLNLISGITENTFEINIKDTTCVVKAGRSSYKLAMIYDNDQLVKLPRITLYNETVGMTIDKDILHSILNINSKEIMKAKKAVQVAELNKLCYLTNEGAFTRTDSACLNSFSLEKPIKVVINDRLIKLFKLFNTEVNFHFGYDDYNGIIKAKVVFETPNVYVAALVNCEDQILTKFQGNFNAVKNRIGKSYVNHLVVSTNVLSAALARLMMFSKNSGESSSQVLFATFTLKDNEIIIQDKQLNTEVIKIENSDSYFEQGYNMKLNIIDVKTVLDSYKNEFVTINCGDHQAVIITHQNISHMLPEAIS